jgi:hypothetical protein
MATDNSQFFPNRKALSQEFNYTPKPSSVNGRTFRVSVPSSNAPTFLAGQTMIFNIPCARRNCVLDPNSSYIRYTIKNTTTTPTAAATAITSAPFSQFSTPGSTAGTVNFGAGLFVDHNAYSIFNTSTLYSGSNMIEYINGCNILYSYLLDTNFSYANALSNSLQYGMYVPDSSVLEVRRGTLLSSVATSTASATGITSVINEQNTFCLPLLSGLLGIGSSGKMVPIYAINDVLRLEIILENQTQAFVQLGTFASPTPSYSVINAELELQFIELSEEGMSLVNSTAPSNSPMFIVGNSFRHYVQTIKNGTVGQYSCLVPSKLASLKALHMLFRRNTEISSATSYSLSSRINPNLDYIVLKISGTQIPQKPITLQGVNTTGGFSEGLIELNKCFSSLLSTDKANLLMTTNYNVAISANTATGVFGTSTDLLSYRNAFAAAVDLELFGTKDTIINGLNCLAESMYFEANIATDPGADITIDFFASFDNLFIIDQTGYVSSRA